MLNDLLSLGLVLLYGSIETAPPRAFRSGPHPCKRCGPFRFEIEKLLWLGGRQLSAWEELAELSELYRNRAIRLHLDGARVWHP